jgi:sulfoxide reductase heme-binding subunit YedZ
MRLSIKQKLLITKSSIFVGLMIPLCTLVVGFITSDLGANPVEKMTHVTGDLALRILLLSLAMTPLQHLLRWRKAILYRRLLGLMAFFYAILHFIVYLVFDQELSILETFADVKKRPYITAGFAALILMVPLAITSTDRLIKRMGIKNWQRLHKSVYLVAVLAITHFWWLVKADTKEPLIYALIFVTLMLLRLARLRGRPFMKRAKMPPQ